LHNLEREIRALQVATAGGGAESGAADFERLSQLESGRLFTLHRELLVGLYGCVTAVVAGVALLVKNNLDRIGPLTLIVTLLVAAGLCYATAIRKHLRDQPRSLASDYILLLGALLFSAAIAYAEVQFKLFDTGWSRHLLLLAAFHAFTAYMLDSKLVLTVALTSFAGWLGVEATLGNAWEPRYVMFGKAWRALTCATVFLAARELHRRLKNRRDFLEIYDHFATNFAFWGALALTFDRPTQWLGALIVAALALYVGIRGFRQGREPYVLYAVGYGTLGLAVLEGHLLNDPLAVTFLILMTLIGALALLWHLRARMKMASL
jgi:hypothetical protein